MRLRTLVSLMLVAIIAGMAGGASAIPAAAHGGGLAQTADPISGEWDVSFFVQGTTTPATFNLKLEGGKVTGTAVSAHTGPGTLREGSWANNKLSFTLDFKSHESIAVSGTLQDGKLVGEFRTEGFVSKWEAKKKTTASVNAGVSADSPAAADPISGEWEATFAGQGNLIPATMTLKLEGEKVTGTFASTHVGDGAISGSWKADQLSFSMVSPQMSATITGNLKAGKLVGDFAVGEIKGTWEAKKK